MGSWLLFCVTLTSTSYVVELKRKNLLFYTLYYRVPCFKINLQYNTLHYRVSVESSGAARIWK